MANKVDPLSNGAPIVDDKGAPTRYFQQLWQRLFLSSGEIVTVQQAVNALFARKINTTAPILGGGDLSADRTLSHGTSGVTAGTYGDATNVAQITVDARGHVTAAANVAISGGGGGGAVALISNQTLVATAASVTFSAIPGTYRELWLTINTLSSAAAAARLRFNGDTGANYSHDRVNRFGSSSANGATSIDVGSVDTVAGAIRVEIPNYSGATITKGLCGNGYVLSGGTPVAEYCGGTWNNTAAITSITLFPSTGVFSVGASFSLYGVV